jgi:hypothetical protein
MIAYKFEIENLSYSFLDKDKPDVVLNVHWKLIGAAGDLKTQISGDQPIELNANKEFIPYKDLTESVTMEWLMSAMGEQKVNELKKMVDEKISRLKPSTIGNGLPWAV